MHWNLRTGTPAHSGGSGSPLTLTLGAAVQTGDRIIVLVNSNTVDPVHPAISAVTDQLGNVYRQDIASPEMFDSPNVVRFRHWVYSAPVTVAGIPTISAAGTIANGTMAAVAYSGVSQAASPVEVSASVASGLPGDALPSSGAVSTGANQLVIGVFSNDGQNKVFSAGAGFTLRTSGAGNGTAGDIAIEDKDSVAGSQTATGSLSSASPWVMSVLVYKPDYILAGQTDIEDKLAGKTVYAAYLSGATACIH